MRFAALVNVLTLLVMLTGPAVARNKIPPVVDAGGTRFAFDFRAATGGAYKKMGGVARWGIPVDVLALFRIDIAGTGNTIMPELGYAGSFHADTKIQSHYFVGGVGYGYSSRWFATGMVPSIVVGATEDFGGRTRDGLGMRVTAFVEVPRTVGFHLTYQAVLSGGVVEHQYLVTASLNAVVLHLCRHFFR